MIKKYKAETVPLKYWVKIFSVHHRIFNQNNSICNDHCNQCFGETTQARYDCISIKTWGCFIFMCILTVVLSSVFIFAANLKISQFIVPLFGRFTRRMGPNPVLMELEKAAHIIMIYTILHQPKNTLPYIILLKTHCLQFQFMLTIIVFIPKTTIFKMHISWTK